MLKPAVCLVELVLILGLVLNDESFDLEIKFWRWMSLVCSWYDFSHDLEDYVQLGSATRILAERNDNWTCRFISTCLGNDGAEPYQICYLSQMLRQHFILSSSQNEMLIELIAVRSTREDVDTQRRMVRSRFGDPWQVTGSLPVLMFLQN